MCQLLGLPANEVLYIGDDFANDYEGAGAAGLASVLFDPAGKSDAGIARISWFGELLER